MIYNRLLITADGLLIWIFNGESAFTRVDVMVAATPLILAVHVKVAPLAIVIVGGNKMKSEPS